MDKNDNFIFKLNNQFENFIPPLSDSEYQNLKHSIIENGCIEPICIWNETILDGHNRYKICVHYNIPFKIAYIFLKSHDEVIAWICANRLIRDNITDETRRYLLGKLYNTKKNINIHGETETVSQIKERHSTEYKISPSTVDKYGLCRGS